MTPAQTLQQLQQELRIHERLAKLLAECARQHADSIYRKTSNVSDHAALLRLTGEAAGVENFINNLVKP